MLRNKNVTLTFLLSKDVSLMIQNYFSHSGAQRSK